MRGIYSVAGMTYFNNKEWGLLPNRKDIECSREFGILIIMGAGFFYKELCCAFREECLLDNQTA
jgi:hypothetical protein